MISTTSILNGITGHKYITALLYSLAGFFLPIYPAMIGVGVLIMIDTVTGVLAARKLGKPITSSEFGRCITKSLVYQLLIIAGHIFDTLLSPIGGTFVVSAVLAGIGATEVLSVHENIQKITGKTIISNIRQLFDNKLRGYLSKQEQDKEVTS